MKHILSLFACLMLVSLAYGQQGDVQIIGDAELEMMIDYKVASVDTIDLWGYRIQIFFGSNRAEANKLKQRYIIQYPDLYEEVYMDYFQPNWRLRVGNFYRKIDAQKLMRTLEIEFGDVFLVRDKIELPVLK